MEELLVDLVFGFRVFDDEFAFDDLFYKRIKGVNVLENTDF